jgi:uncharacterized membrane protein YhaH (DUF805 family)
MAVTKIRKISNIVFLIAVAISLVVMGLFAFGGQVPEAEKLVPDMSQPVHLDLLLNWTYILVAITVVVVLCFAIFGFVKGLKDAPKKAIGGLLALVALAALLFITYSIGCGETLDILGYTGPHNVYGWLKIVDMWIYSIYVMVAVTILAIIITPLIVKLMKK